MTKEEILENNKLIAEFMGIEIVERNGESAIYMHEDDKHPEYFRATKHNRYHCSWDALMPVVENIEAMGYIFEIWKNKADWFKPFEAADCTEYQADTKLSATYQAVVSFIKQVKG